MAQTQEVQPGIHNIPECGRPWDDHDWFSPIEWQADEELSFTDNYPIGSTAWKFRGHIEIEPTCPVKK